MSDLWQRAAIGPVSGKLVLAAGVLFHGSWVVFGVLTLVADRRHPAQGSRQPDGD